MFFVKLTLWQRVLSNLVFVILTSFSIQNLKISLNMVLPKLNCSSIPSISAFISKIYCHQTNPTFSQNIVNYDGIWHFYMNKFKKLIIDFENKYLQMSLLYNYFHEAKLKCNIRRNLQNHKLYWINPFYVFEVNIMFTCLSMLICIQPMSSSSQCLLIFTLSSCKPS